MEEINQINELFLVNAPTEDEKKSEKRQCHYVCHTLCIAPECPPKLHECTCSLTILVDITKWDTPPRLYFVNELYNLKGWITLKDNLNFFCWCCVFDSDIHIARSKSDYDNRMTLWNRYILKNIISKTIIYPSEDTRCISINMKNYKKCTGQCIWWQNLTLSKDSNKSHQITDVNILCKGNEPPSLFNLCKLAYLTKVMQGKINKEYLPCLFNVSKTKVPSHLNLNSITMKHLKPYIEP